MSDIASRVKNARYIAVQTLECGEHAYFMGEKIGHEVDLNEAIIDWTTNKDIIVNGNHHEHKKHAERFREVYEKHKEEMNEQCDYLCGTGNCNCLKESGTFYRDFIERCRFAHDMKKLHDILSDGWVR